MDFVSLHTYAFHDTFYNQSLKWGVLPEEKAEIILTKTKKNYALGELAKQKGIDLVLCISAAQRRGLLSRDEAQRQQKLDDDLADGFRISGLGQLVEAMLDADRFIVFGK